MLAFPAGQDGGEEQQSSDVNALRVMEAATSINATWWIDFPSIPLDIRLKGALIKDGCV